MRRSDLVYGAYLAYSLFKWSFKTETRTKAIKFLFIALAKNLSSLPLVTMGSGGSL